MAHGSSRLIELVLILCAHCSGLLLLPRPTATWKIPISPRGRKSGQRGLPFPLSRHIAFLPHSLLTDTVHRTSIPIISNSQLPLGHKHKKWTTGDTIIASSFVEIHRSTSRRDLLGRSSLRYAMTFHGRW